MKHRAIPLRQLIRWGMSHLKTTRAVLQPAACAYGDRNLQLSRSRIQNWKNEQLQQAWWTLVYCHCNAVVLCTIIARNSCRVLKLLHNYFLRATRCNNCRHSNMSECLQLLPRDFCMQQLHMKPRHKITYACLQLELGVSVRRPNVQRPRVGPSSAAKEASCLQFLTLTVLCLILYFFISLFVVCCCFVHSVILCCILLLHIPLS